MAAITQAINHIGGARHSRLSAMIPTNTTNREGEAGEEHRPAFAATGQAQAHNVVRSIRRGGG